MTVLERLLADIRSFGDKPVARTISRSEVRELERAVGLINAIVFEVEDDEDDEGATDV